MKSLIMGAALIAVVVVGGACGGGGSDVNAGDGDATASTAPEASDTTAETTPDASGVDVDALYEELFGVFDDPAKSQELYAEQQRESEELIRACMAEQGFDYVPVDYSQFDTFGGEFDEDEYVATYGYGISTYLGEEAVFEDQASDEFVDPNGEIVESMTDGERDAYYLALYGEQVEYDPTLDESEQDYSYEPTGCQGEAYSATNNGFEVYDEFGEELEDVYTRAQADPRIVEMETRWSKCMADAGHTFATHDDIYTELQALVAPFEQAVYGSEETFEDPLADMTQEEIDALTEEDYRVLFPQPTLPPELQADLDEVQAKELAIAAADQKCSTDDQQNAEAIFEEYMRAFVSENADALAAFSSS